MGRPRQRGEAVPNLKRRGGNYNQAQIRGLYSRLVFGLVEGQKKSGRGPPGVLSFFRCFC